MKFLKNINESLPPLVRITYVPQNIKRVINDGTKVISWNEKNRFLQQTCRGVEKDIRTPVSKSP